MNKMGFEIKDMIRTLNNEPLSHRLFSGKYVAYCYLRYYWNDYVKANKYPPLEDKTLELLREAVYGAEKENITVPLLLDLSIACPSSPLDWSICAELYHLKIIANEAYGLLVTNLEADEIYDNVDCVTRWDKDLEEIYWVLWGHPSNDKWKQYLFRFFNIISRNQAEQDNLADKLFPLLVPKIGKKVMTAPTITYWDTVKKFKEECDTEIQGEYLEELKELLQLR